MTDHVAHRIALKPKLLGEVEEDVFYFFHGYWYLLVGSPGGVWICAETGVGEG